MAFSDKYFSSLDEAKGVQRGKAENSDILWSDIKSNIDTYLLPFINDYKGNLSPVVRTNKPGQNHSYYKSHWCLFCVDKKLGIGVKLDISPDGIKLVYDFPHDKYNINKTIKEDIKNLTLPVVEIDKQDVVKLSNQELYKKIDNYHTTNKLTYSALYDIVSALPRKIDKTSATHDVNEGSENSGLIQTPEPLNQILFGPPGTGKTYNTIFKTLDILGVRAVDKGDNKTSKSTWFDNKDASREKALEKFKTFKNKKRIVFTTFHQSMSYEDFIEGIKPKTGNQKNVTYSVESGIFKIICNKAKNDKDKQPYVLIIDEINRGNVANIFGELITLIEEDKRLGKSEAIEVQLPYSTKDEGLFGVPSNLYIIGTMNTADRSVEALDSALRRRFSFVEMMPKPELLNGVKIKDFSDITLKDLLETINKRIEVLKDREHQIGHSYFMKFAEMKVVEADALKEVFTDKIIPLLQEYFYGDYEKIQLVLGNGFVEQETTTVTFAGNSSYDDIPEKSYKIIREPKMAVALATLLNTNIDNKHDNSDQSENSDIQ